MRKMALLFLATLTTMALFTACGQKEQTEERQQVVIDENLSPGEQLRQRLLNLGNDTQISSNEDMEALWNFLNSNSPTDEERTNWELTQDCSLTIMAGRSLIKLVEGENITYISFVATIDCPQDIAGYITFISPKGTYTSDNSKRWYLGRETEVTELQ